MTDRLKGKVALITGGGGGIGEATAALFLEEGARVALVDANADDLTSVAEHLARATGSSERIMALPTDITSEMAVRDAVDAIVANFNRLDVLANIAGVRIPPGDVTSIPLEQWQHVLNVNVLGSVLCSKFAIPPMMENGGGSVIFLSSVAAQTARSGWAPYDTSKAALFALARDMACDHVKSGVRVNVLCPGPTLTKFHVRNLAQSAGVSLAEAEQRLKSQGASCLMNRQAEPREIAFGLLFLASDESSFVTGSIMNVDGGMPEAKSFVPTPAEPKV